MFSEQREVLDEIIVKMRAGRMTRRTFLERAFTIGLTSSVATSLLEACDPGIQTIVWESEHDAANVYSRLVDSFNEQKTGIHVIYRNGPSDSGLQYKELTRKLQSGGEPDVLSMDIIWVAEFASKQWISPLEGRWQATERTRYLPGPIQGCTFNGHIWAAPFRIDVGLLYYRTDLVSPSTLPTTWEQLTELAEHFQSNGPTNFGYVWQGASYEGLTCNFIEVLYGYGGSVFAPGNHNPPLVTVNSPQAVQALTEMVKWVGRASPNTVVTYKEEDARAVWQQAYAAFMRNWPYAYSLGNKVYKENKSAYSEIVGEFDVHAVLPGGSNKVGHSCVGGWQLGINARSNNPDAAWTFMQYMLSQPAQRIAALNGSLTVTLKSVYEDSDVLDKHPFFGTLQPIFQNARSRPVSLKYADITKAIQGCVYQALTKASSPASALSTLQNNLQQIVSS